MKGKAPRYFILILVENRPGVLARVSDLFCARGFNIDTLSVAETLDPRFSRVTCTTSGEERTVEQIIKHLRRLIEVRRVLHVPLDDPDHVSRELLLVKLRSPRKARGEVLRLAGIFRARVVDITDGNRDPGGDRSASETRCLSVRPETPRDPGGCADRPRGPGPRRSKEAGKGRPPMIRGAWICSA